MASAGYSADGGSPARGSIGKNRGVRQARREMIALSAIFAISAVFFPYRSPPTREHEESRTLRYPAWRPPTLRTYQARARNDRIEPPGDESRRRTREAANRRVQTALRRVDRARRASSHGGGAAGRRSRSGTWCPPDRDPRSTTGIATLDRPRHARHDRSMT